MVYQLPEENTIFCPGFVMVSPSFIENKDGLKQWLNSSFVGYFKVKKGTDIQNLEKKNYRFI